VENRAQSLISIILAFAIASCTDAGLQPLAEEIEYVDDKIEIEGRLCTSPADEVAFPIKIFIVIDQSASLQCTDPGNNRLTALNQAGSSLDSLPNVEFGVLGFASWSRIWHDDASGSVFTPNWGDISPMLAPENGQGGPATDYQGALSTVLRVLEQDMIDSGAALCARTKYVVLFLSDGIPEPRCTAGCEDGDEPPDSLYGVCNTTEEIPEDVYVDMHSLCPDYNQPEQIMQKVEDIMALCEFYGVGELKLNTILLFAPEEEIAEVCGDVSEFGYVKEEAEPLLKGMAEEGLGTYRDVNISTEIDFLDFDYESLEAPYEMAELFAVNMNAVPIENGVGIDSDMDGVEDSKEFEMGMNRLSGDSDGDRFGDLLELKYETKGFDPLDVNVPAMGCEAASDRDGDGLRECEEIFLGTDPLLADTDGDRIPDGIELRFGIDPTVHDTLIDHDFDGRLSGMEVCAGTSPKLVDEESTLLNQILYGVVPGPLGEDEVRCYDFSIQGITLVPTLNVPGEQMGKGANRILILFEEEPQSMAGSRGRFYVACVEARYLGDTYKDPASGLIQGLSPLRFVELPEFVPETHCLKLGEDPAQPLVEEEQ
jgi:hypothetical protein